MLFPIDLTLKKLLCISITETHSNFFIYSNFFVTLLYTESLLRGLSIKLLSVSISLIRL